MFPIRAWYKYRAPLEFPFGRPAKGFALTVTAERCLSGRKSTPGKCVYVNSVPGVRIPLSPPPPCSCAWSDPCQSRLISVVRSRDTGFTARSVVCNPDTAPRYCRSMDIQMAISFTPEPPTSSISKAINPGDFKYSYPTNIVIDRERAGRQVFCRYFQSDSESVVSANCYVIL